MYGVHSMMGNDIAFTRQKRYLNSLKVRVCLLCTRSYTGLTGILVIENPCRTNHKP